MININESTTGSSGCVFFLSSIERASVGQHSFAKTSATGTASDVFQAAQRMAVPGIPAGAVPFLLCENGPIFFFCGKSKLSGGSKGDHEQSSHSRSACP